ncbi:R3H domain-containing nucleic acid-binding protein [uncultured Desulfovibrio sp.]|uniref:Jag family protein n=1 Tax=uncultured Desulfovibrio sp. TaxID=167968 RepID=UPI00262D05AD|nr:R3H domain-containing nucleic acid-binding protein [uncultured Desulfovibrio sp.]
MDGFKEFQGKNLDAAIQEACSYYNAAREKLEIEIVQDAKSGIFGIVGARKAKIRARRAALREAVESVLGKKRCDVRLERPSLGREEAPRRPAEKVSPAAREESVAAPAEERPARKDEKAEKSEKAERQEKPAENARQPRGRGRGRDQARAAAAAEAPAEEAPAENAAPEAGNRRGEGRRARPRPSVRGEGEGRRRQRPQAPAVPAPVENTEDVLDEVEESLPFTPVEELDPQRLEALTKEAVRQLVRPIVGEEVTLEVTVADGRVRVAVDCEEDSGLLIGREGQTLASLQYLASRVVSRGMNAAVRVQLDAGRYRQRQDEKLREMALALAEKVRQTGRSYSTRPLSSYHRRIVHLCLQDAEEVQTRSSGDGPMKRVVIMRRRPERS